MNFLAVESSTACQGRQLCNDNTFFSKHFHPHVIVVFAAVYTKHCRSIVGEFTTFFLGIGDLFEVIHTQ